MRDNKSKEEERRESEERRARVAQLRFRRVLRPVIIGSVVQVAALFGIIRNESQLMDRGLFVPAVAACGLLFGAYIVYYMIVVDRRLLRENGLL